MTKSLIKLEIARKEARSNIFQLYDLNSLLSYSVSDSRSTWKLRVLIVVISGIPDHNPRSPTCDRTFVPRKMAINEYYIHSPNIE